MSFDGMKKEVGGEGETKFILEKKAGEYSVKEEQRKYNKVSFIVEWENCHVGG